MEVLAIRLVDFVRLEVSANLCFVGVLAASIVLVIWLSGRHSLGSKWEIDQADLGLGGQKISVRPNSVDRDVAYKIWVELSTRKIGLPIDESNDIVIEIYDSWYEFFKVTRELIKEVPARHLGSASTSEIVNLSIAVLNEIVRPHLTTWQARLRNWQRQNDSSSDPQEAQTEYPKYEELIADLKEVNTKIRFYRAKLYELASGGR